jgi:hypothetical protein
MVELGLAIVYGFHVGDIEKATYTLNQIEKKFGKIADVIWRLAEIKQHLATGTPCPGSRLYWPSPETVPVEKAITQDTIATVQKPGKPSGPCGYVDRCLASDSQVLSISGWAADFDPGAFITDVQIWIDGKLTQRCLPFMSRPDSQNSMISPALS